MHLVSVGENVLERLASWKEATSERPRILVPIETRGSYAVVLTCGDPRFLEAQCSQFNKLYGLSNAFVFTEIGGALRLYSPENPERNPYYFMCLKRLCDVEALLGLHPDDGVKIDLWLATHIECKWANVNALPLADALWRNQLTACELQRQLPIGRYNIRFEFHHFWPRTRKHKTYEINPILASQDLERTVETSFGVMGLPHPEVRVATA